MSIERAIKGLRGRRRQTVNRYSYRAFIRPGNYIARVGCRITPTVYLTQQALSLKRQMPGELRLSWGQTLSLLSDAKPIETPQLYKNTERPENQHLHTLASMQLFLVV